MDELMPLVQNNAVLKVISQMVTQVLMENSVDQVVQNQRKTQLQTDIYARSSTEWV